MEDHEAFTVYRDTPGVSVSDVARMLHRSTLVPIAARNRWRARKAAYVAAMSLETETAAVGRARELGIEHAEAVAELRYSAFERLRSAFITGEVPPALAAKIFTECINLERLDAGKPTERTALDLSGKSEAELAELEKLLRPAPAPVQAPALPASDPEAN